MRGTNGTSLKLTLCGVLAAVSSICQASSASGAEFWLTDPDGAARFQKQNRPLAFGAPANSDPTIVVDPSRTFQTMDGFGYTLTGGSATHLLRMSAPARAALLRELFAADSTNIGVSYLRIAFSP